MTDAAPRTTTRPVWLLLLAIVALAIGLANAGVFLYALTLPNRWAVETSIAIDAPPEAVYPLLAEPRRWPEWSVWSTRRDATMEFGHDGPERGQGAKLAWLGRESGTGEIEITEALPGERVGYRLSLQGSEFSNEGEIRLEPADGGTMVRWSDGGELGGTMARLFRERLEASVASEYAESLRGLKRQVEGRNP